MNGNMLGKRAHAITRGMHDIAIRKAVRRGKPLDVISRELGCSRDLITRRMRVLHEEMPSRHPVSAGMHDGVLIAMAQQGERVVAIAARLECGADIVAQRLGELGEAART